MIQRRTSKSNSPSSRAGKAGSKPGRKSGKPRAKKSGKESSSRAAASTNLLLRDIDPQVLAVLRRRAAESGRSIQQELHLALARGTQRNYDEARALAAAWQQRLAGRDLPDSTAMIREDRQR
ncbi:MAG: hypothetical protein IT430_11690 [Phycisphaerales bacterium]|nr:hypothetical protein [Phycisphaerales bacterium]